MMRAVLGLCLVFPFVAPGVSAAQEPEAAPSFRETALRHLAYSPEISNGLRLLDPDEGAPIAEAVVRQVAEWAIPQFTDGGRGALDAMRTQSVCFQTDEATLVAIPNLRGGPGLWVIVVRRSEGPPYALIYDGYDCLSRCRTELHALHEGAPALFAWLGSDRCSLSYIDLSDRHLDVRCGPDLIGTGHEPAPPALQSETIRPPRFSTRGGSLVVESELRGVLYMTRGQQHEFVGIDGPILRRRCRFHAAFREFECHQAIHAAPRRVGVEHWGPEWESQLPVRDRNLRFVREHLTALRSLGFRLTRRAAQRLAAPPVEAR